ncbi:hypothetical protein AVEN_148540-1 [Araneus ventricosus]|uniref:Reverse transcriptase domain-containing protein n=1 Tax=Araneus ventricosus TaxID=182803 RepID=A0A4Y2M6M1_ARAVE|nr:hypothetical protein AVEN_148540-1 [Araneus ventricosus]
MAKKNLFFLKILILPKKYLSFQTFFYTEQEIHPKYLRRTSDQGPKTRLPSRVLQWTIPLEFGPNYIFQENLPINTIIQSFADEFVLVFHAPTRVKFELQIKESIAKISTWESKNQLQTSADKTNYLLIRMLVMGPTIRWKGERTKRVYAFKYLFILMKR